MVEVVGGDALDAAEVQRQADQPLVPADADGAGAELAPVPPDVGDVLQLAAGGAVAGV